MKIKIAALLNAGFKVDLIDQRGERRDLMEVPHSLEGCTIDIYGTSGIPESMQKEFKKMIKDEGLACYAMEECYQAIERAQILAVLKEG